MSSHAIFVAAISAAFLAASASKAAAPASDGNAADGAAADTAAGASGGSGGDQAATKDPTPAGYVGPDIPAGGTSPNNPTRYFSTREGYDADGHATFAFDLALFLYLPSTHATIGLNRPNGTDVTIDRPRPTIADISKLAYAFDCDCMVRYGDWSAEVTFLYLSTKEQTRVAPLPPALPAATLNTNLRVAYVQPGIGYRLFRWDQVSIDVRAGITYAGLTVDSDFAAGEFSHSGSYGPSFVQGWAGARIDYYPTPRWRIESTAAMTGIFQQAGWNAKIAASYLFTKWFGITIGYRASQTNQQGGLGLGGVNRNINILFRGPMASLDFRF